MNHPLSNPPDFTFVPENRIVPPDANSLLEFNSELMISVPVEPILSHYLVRG